MSEGRFVVAVSGTDSHTIEELEEACRQLWDDLGEVDGIELSELTTEAPEGARSGDLATVSAALVLSLISSRAAFVGVEDYRRIKKALVPAVARIFSLWLGRNREVKAVITLPDGTHAELTNVSEDGIRDILLGGTSDKTHKTGQSGG